MEYEIQTEFQGPGFVAVPNEVAQSAALSPEALGVLVYLASQPRGWLARVASIQERFALGKDKWQRIARELREVGAMETRIMRGSGGRAIGKRMVVRWPEIGAVQSQPATESRETRLSDRKPEKPAAGKPAKVCRETRQSVPGNPAPYKEEKKQTARGRAARPCVRPAATSAQPLRSAPVLSQAEAAQGAWDSRLNGNRREYLGPDGVWYPEPRDAEEAERFHRWRQAARTAPAVCDGKAVRYA